MRPGSAAVARWSRSGLLSRILRGPVPFEVASVRSHIVNHVYNIHAAPCASTTLCLVGQRVADSDARVLLGHRRRSASAVMDNDL